MNGIALFKKVINHPLARELAVDLLRSISKYLIAGGAK